MEKSSAIRIIRKTFQNPFDREIFVYFIKSLLNHIEPAPFIYRGNFIPDAFAPYIKTLERIGKYQDKDDKKIDLLIVYLKKEKSLERARTMQRNFIAWYLNGSRGDVLKDAALVAFVSPNSEDWRFSLVRMNYRLDASGEKIKVKQELTPARRFSFLVGKNESSHTAQSQLLDILEDDENNPTLAQIEEAFSVERVTKEFYQEYKKLFDNLCEELNKNRVFQMIKETKRIDTANFAKKLLGQIVFLYFIQKKGWLGVPMNKKWGEGDRAFLRHLFEKAKEENKNFFNDCLEHLFYNVLNKKPDLPGSFYRKYFDSQIPFLNGGLFEPMKGYNWEKTFLDLDNDLFSNSSKTGILDIFDRYNFTVKEDEPLEKEVAIDPEMLGKVFENLLEENLRKGKGTYYTPREIVHYMCQESLINYLVTESKIDEEKIRKLVTQDSIIDLSKDIDEQLKQKSIVFTDEEVEGLDKLLKDIKVVDPACGSGAFLVGMLQLIIHTRRRLTDYLVLFSKSTKNRSEYQLKKETIQNCIYGVDIDPGAVEIAKLRLWLSLVVDYELEEIEPLPNLDYKVMQGNSLLEELVLGNTVIKLFDPNLVMTKKKKMKNLFEEEKQKDLFEKQSQVKRIIMQLDNLRKKYFRISDLSEKFQVKKQIEDIEQNLVKECVDREIKKLDVQLKNIGQYIVPGIGMTEKDAKRVAKTLSIQASIMEMWQEFRESGVRPFFLWRLYFADVFQEKGGFDIIIANPPYIQLQKNQGELANLYNGKRYETYDRMGDIYCLFYEKGIELLKNSGILCYISSNKWMRARYGEKLRQFFLKYNPKILIDLGPDVFETATVDTCILLVQKSKNKNKSRAITINEKKKDSIDIAQILKERGVILPNLSKGAWFIGTPKEQKLKEKIERIGKPLKKWDVKIYRGILTGLNEAFIIDQKTYDKLVTEDPKSKEILKPILRGRDIKKYRYEWEGLWLINIHNGYINENGQQIDPINVNDYPVVKRYLIQFYDKLKNRDDKGITPYNLRHCAYIEEFEKEKMVWQEIVREPSFAYDTKKFYCEATTFLMTGENLKYLLAILNSKSASFFFKKFYAGGGLGDEGYRYKKAFLENLPIPPIIPQNKSTAKKIENLVDKILALTRSKNYSANETKQKRVKEYEKEIDKLVYKLYGLTPKEVKIIETTLLK